MNLPADLEPSRRGLIGKCGEASVFCFRKLPGDRFYGLGEKWTGLEHSGRHFRFWNTDVWGDFHPAQHVHLKPPPDPVYAAIPYLILKRNGRYLGLFLDTIQPASVSTKSAINIAGQMDLDEGEEEFWLSVDAGPARLLVFEGPSLGELTRRFQNHVGATPLPPAWALGYHQCRWGYQSERDLLELDRKMSQHGIPCDGLWLDIEYMDGYRVFTLDPKNFQRTESTLERLAQRGRQVVPIIDPGVKIDSEYGVYQRGRKQRAFCQNPGGQEYVGLVWPGETAFPDFSLPSVRKWWAREVAAFLKSGFGGAWLDMNDPSTGKSDNNQMLFERGKRAHSEYHNAYALGMAEATRKGFLQARPGERPFLLCRSGCAGIQRHTALWTGDNHSTYVHLKACVATTLNLALSGVPFNGPDVGGFGGDSFPALMRDWFKACFLFPFFRNHTIVDSRQQEPWAFDATTLRVVRHFIRLRYRLRPFLYQLFHRHHRTGEAILRPLFYDFEEAGRFDLVDDAFMVGPSILHAPFLEESQAEREVPLPGGTQWYDAFAGKWREGGQTLRVKAAPASTPLYLRDGSLVPLARVAPQTSDFSASEVDLHLILSDGAKGALDYVSDDGLSLSNPDATKIRVAAERRGKRIDLETTVLKEGGYPGRFVYTVPAGVTSVVANGRRLERYRHDYLPLGRAVWKTFA
ncbi:MAG: glycoside hydrolase family 31 protein [Verrucomicrobiota bacterium]